MLLIILLILTIILDAIAEGLMQTNKLLGHPVKALYVLLFLGLAIYGIGGNCIKDFFYIVFAYILIRHGIFDYIRNLAAGVKIDYVGNTSLYDKYIASTWIGSVFIRFACLFCGVWMLLVRFNVININ